MTSAMSAKSQIRVHKTLVYSTYTFAHSLTLPRVPFGDFALLHPSQIEN